MQACSLLVALLAICQLEKAQVKVVNDALGLAEVLFEFESGGELAWREDVFETKMLLAG